MFLSFNNIRRFCCVPVDFEIVRVDSSASSEDDINNAVTAIKRNGVALKGEHEEMVHQAQKCLYVGTISYRLTLDISLVISSVFTFRLPLSSYNKKVNLKGLVSQTGFQLSQD